ncbi:MAG: ParA family protein [Pseudomonadota bacterium]
MSIWAVSNQKGGVGKTTTAITLSGWLATRGENVLLIDLDPHGSMTSYFGHDPDTLTQGVYQLFQQAANKEETNVQALILSTRFKNLHLLPSSTAIATLDRQLGTQDGMGLVLARAILSLRDTYQHIFIDCPPMLGVLMINALAACDKLLIPVQTEFLALKGLDRMLSTMAMINRARKRPLAYTIIPTMFDRRTRASIETLRMIKENYSEDKLANAIIPVDTRFREASMKGVPLSILNPLSRGAKAYNILLDGLLADEN